MRYMYKSHVLLIMVSVAACLAGGCSEIRDPVKLYNMGVDAYNAKKYSEAMSMFKWSQELHREFSPPMIGLARCHLVLAEQELARSSQLSAFRDLQDALYWSNQAINADPGNLDGFRTKIAVLKAMGRAESAIQTAEWAAKNVGPSAKTMLMLARTYLDLKEQDQAEEALKRGLGIWPEDTELTLELAKLYDKTGRLKQALAYYEQLYRLDPTYDPELLMRIAELKATTPTPQPGKK